MSGIKNIFWIDYYSGNYQDIEKIISTNNQKKLNLFPFKNLKSAIEEISKVQFEIIFVVIKGDLYQDYFSILNDIKSRLTCFPINIIYSSNNSINLNSNNFIGYVGLITSREKLIIFIHNFIESVNSKIKLNPKVGVTIDYNNALTFEKIESKDDLVIPSLYVLYKKIEGNENIINDEDIYKFNNILVNNHFDDDISELIVPLNDVKKVPLEIVSKFWIRYYTCQSSFYPYMNTQLMKNKHENYEIFVRAMYKGIEKKYLQTEYNIRLYRCQLISKEEMDILKNDLILVYSRTFLSFSKDKNKAINFLKKGNNNLKPVMLVINSINLEEAYSSNADIEQFSIFSHEREVLFFPFSSFIIDEKIDTQIIKGIETKIINLNYLGKYRKEIENKINTLNENEIKKLLSKDSKFVKDISSIKLNENKIELNQIELKKSIQKAIKKVKEDTLIKFKLEEKNNNCEIINPYKILGISEKEKHPEYRDKEKFREKIKTEKQYLSCFVLDNINKYSRIENDFLINKDAFYYIIKNDLQNLKKLYEENKYIILQKDFKKRSLLHYSVICGNYEISEFLLKNGINYDDPDYEGTGFPHTALYYADEKHEELLKSFGAEIEVYNMVNYLKGINTIKSQDINIIDSLYNELLKKGLVQKMLDVKLLNEVVGKKLIKTRHLRDSMRIDEEEIEKWEKVYHGTRFSAVEFILNYGLQNFGEPLKNHILPGIGNYGIEDWASAIFVSPSIFYASKYSELVNYKNEEWSIIMEARVKPNSFSIHGSTLYDYKFKEGEPKNVEYRISCEKIPENKGIKGLYERSDIVVTSLTFVKKKFLDNTKYFRDSSIFYDN